MNSYEYMTEIKRIKGLDTDYKLCKALGWRQNKVTQYKNGTSMDNDTSRQVAEILEIPLIQVIAEMEIQRAKNTEQKRAWSRIAKMTKEAGLASTNLLINISLFSSTLIYCILCKIRSKCEASPEIKYS